MSDKMIPRDPDHAQAWQSNGKSQGLPLGDEPPDEGVREALGVIYRRRLPVLLTTILGGVAAAYLVVQEVPLYRASAQIRLIDEKENLTAGIVSADGRGTLAQGADFISSQIEVLLSGAIAREVVTQEGLQLRPVSQGARSDMLDSVRVQEPPPRDTLRFAFAKDGFTVAMSNVTRAAKYGERVDLGMIHFIVPRQPALNDAAFVPVSLSSAIADFRRDLRARQKGRSDMVDIEFTAADPVFGARMATATANVFQAYNATDAQTAARNRREFLETQMAETDSLAQLAMADLAAFKARQGASSTLARMVGEEEGAAEAERSRQSWLAQKALVEKALADWDRATTTGERLRAAAGAPLAAVSNPALVDIYVTEIVDATNKVDSLTAPPLGRRETSTEVATLRKLIQQREQQLHGLLGQAVGTINSQLTVLGTQTQGSTARIRQLPAVEAEEQALTQLVLSRRAIAEQLRGEYQKAQISENVEVGPVRVIYEAEPPTQRIGTGRIGKILMGLLAGLLGGATAVLGIERLNTSVRRHDEVEELLRLPKLALVPALHESPNSITKLVGFKNGNGHANGKRRPTALLTPGNGNKSAAEAYRMLRTNLIFSQAVQSMKTLVVTSAAPGEGKSTTAMNLGIAYAQQGVRVLVVDCDLRRPSLHYMTGLPREPGFTQVVMGLVPPQEAIRGLDSVPNLSVLTSGTLPPNPAEMLGGDRARETLAALAHQYDFMIVDTPPVLAAADAAILGAEADGVILVLKVGQTERAAAQRARQQLGVVGARVLGAVLNDPDHKMIGYDAYHGYDYSYFAEDA